MLPLDAGKLAIADESVAPLLGEHCETGHDKCDHGKCLDQAGKFLRPAASAQAEPVQKRQNHHARDRDQLDVLSQARFESGGEFAECYCQVCNRHRLHHPIAAAHYKTDIFAQRLDGNKRTIHPLAAASCPARSRREWRKTRKLRPKPRPRSQATNGAAELRPGRAYAGCQSRPCLRCLPRPQSSRPQYGATVPWWGLE